MELMIKKMKRIAMAESMAARRSWNVGARNPNTAKRPALNMSGGSEAVFGTVEQIAKAAADECGLTVDEILESGQRGDHDTNKARHLAMRRASAAGYTNKDIAFFFGRCQSTVSRVVRTDPGEAA